MLKNFTDFMSGIISIYMFLIIIRIVITWFSPQHSNDPRSVLKKMCDPYLNFFRRMNLVIGNIDFSPIVAITVLVIAANILAQIGLHGTISVGILLSVILRALWSALSSLIFFINIFLVIRIAVLFIRPSGFSPILHSMDSFLVPLSTKAASLFIKGGVSSYQTNLIILFLMLLALYYAGTFSVNLLSGFLLTLPF